MSTKIYNAYKFNGSIIDLMSELKKIRSKHIQKSKELVLRIANEIRKESEHGDNRVKFAYEIIDRVKLSRRSNLIELEGIMIDADATIYPLGDKEFLVQFFRLDLSIKIRHPFKDYHYQNQTDRPKGVSKKEWETREKTWDEVFSKDFSPVTAGFTFQICGDGHDFEILSYLFKNLED